ncbi:NADPH-dependent FMN reductase [Emticicia sp. BO119]|uniref:NADPH-dependent FMN reductase n=1 Tax=Emticicia sp. BO119 TaxID=2757768 RepID=UPI0015F08B1B|nr:NADPH-dependent FMN reductase [Emticicia sp. BO119]MBA4850615.1 NAD(P)H-dependent oxidoreductase [Emticicia sp. BO119]
MVLKKKVLGILGSTKANSNNERLLKKIGELMQEHIDLTIFDKIAELPHFNPDLDNEEIAPLITDFRNQIAEADGVLICTPEYVFSIPGSLKNALEWTVSTVVFSDKPLGIITASASGEKGHEQLQLILRTLGADFNEETLLLISGIKGKINEQGELTLPETEQKVKRFAEAFIKLLMWRWDS